MPSTHLALNVHLVFSTKNREPWIAHSWRSRLHEYLGGIVRGMDAAALAVGGVEDHVHILAGLKAVHRLADIMRELKSGSSRWIHKTVPLAAFAWQEGYGAIAVSPSQLSAVRRYIAGQEAHHRQQSFQEEYREWLRKCGVNFNEEHLW